MIISSALLPYISPRFRKLKLFAAFKYQWRRQASMQSDQSLTFLLSEKENSETSVCNHPYKSRHQISNNVVRATSEASDQPAHTRILIRAFASHMIILGVLSY